MTCYLFLTYIKNTLLYIRSFVIFFVIHITFLSNEGSSLGTLDRLFFPKRKPSNRYGYFEMTRRGIAPF